VDVPDFNLRLAERLKALGIPVAYYVSPMVWAWREGRVKQISRTVDRMLCILPFEEPFYRERGVPAQYVGNPVVEQVPPPGPPSGFRQALGLELQRPTLALLPGSRQSEVQRILPSLVAAAAQLKAQRPELAVVLPVAPSLSKEALRQAFAGTRVQPVLVDGRAPEVVGASDVAVVASGTATLEAALMGRPSVVVYRVSPVSYLVGRALLDVPFISLPNLLLKEEALPELIQGQMNPGRIAAEVLRLLDDGPERQRRLAQLSQLRATLGTGSASQQAADAVLSLLARA
jgi:lipid-A-disaccharide synthase